MQASRHRRIDSGRCGGCAPSAERCRGSIYLTALAVTAIVAVIGVAAMLAVRLQQHVAEQTRDFASARACAQAGLEMGAYWMKHDANWRSDRGNGTWASAMAVGDGQFTLVASDPVGGDVSSGSGDPVVLRSTGQVGEARYTLQAEFAPEAGPGALGVAMQAGGDITVDAGTLSSDQMISANGSITAQNGSTVYGQCQAAGTIGGSGFQNDVAAGTTARTMPNASDALNSYVSSGTAISYDSLPPAGTNMLRNGGFESGMYHWSRDGASTNVTVETTEVHGGTNAVLISNRQYPSDGISQYVANALTNNTTFHVQAWMKQGGSAAVPDARLTLTVWYRPSPYTAAERESWSTPIQTIGSSWTLVQGDLPVSWTGALVGALLRVETASSTGALYVDDASMSTGTGRVLQQVVLSPSSNPFGSGSTNAQGVYVLDCQGQKLIVENCRIVGTLVILNPGLGSLIAGSMNWQPAMANYPALLCNGNLTIATRDVALSEWTLGVNFNPPGTGYPYGQAAGDNDWADAYPSVIQGMIYDSASLVFGGSVRIDGLVVSNGGIAVNGGSVSISYEPTTLEDPPPGFEPSDPVMQLVPGSCRQVVN